MSDTEINEQQPAPDFTLPAVGSDDVVKDGQVHLSDLHGKTMCLVLLSKRRHSRLHERGVQFPRCEPR